MARPGDAQTYSSALSRHEVLGLGVVADERAGRLLGLVLVAGLLGALEADARAVEQVEDRDVVLEVRACRVAAGVAAAAVLLPEEATQARAVLADDKYQEYLLLHGLGVEMAEALAELWHQRIRTEWGFVDEDGPSLGGLFRQQYRGGRYSSGYPACPDLEDNVTILDLLDGTRIGLECSEDTGYQYQPEQTTSALICHHPQAKYFVAR